MSPPDSSTDPRPSAFTALDAHVPLVLLPVRLELRWFAAADPDLVELRVRVFPDVLSLRHDRSGLSSLEIAAGQAYWRARPSDGGAAWAQLSSTVGDARAIYVARRLTPTESSPGTLVFPTIAPDDDPAGPARLEALPDRWFVRGLGAGGTVFDAWSGPVPAHLELEPTASWLSDFAEAKALGMALTVPLTHQSAGALQTIVAFGIREGVAPDAAASSLRSLLDAHAVDQGLAFVPVGTASKAAHDDDRAAALGALETGREGVLPADANGTRLARALGVPLSTFDFVPQAAATFDIGATAANTALWPVTWGYYLEQLMQPLFSAAAIDAARSDFVRFVRARGPLPTLRAGAQPYGVLPIVSLSDWQPFADGDNPRLLSALATVAATWRTIVPPHLDAGDDRANDLQNILTSGPISRRFWIRRMMGRSTIAAERPDWDHIANLDVILDDLRNAIALDPLQALGIADRPLLADRVFDDDALPLRLAIAWAGGDPEQPLPQNYLTGLAEATVESLRNNTVPGATPRSLLYLLLRHSLLLAYAKGGAPGGGGVLDGGVVRGDLERVTDSTDVWRRIDRGHVAARSIGVLDAGTARTEEVMQIKRSLGVLAPLPVAELERLCAETLDLGSHRLDAWITAMATRRLAALRDVSSAGCYVGGFGLISVPALPADDLLARDDGPALHVPLNAGFLHAPSLAQAKTAAVLRAGFLAHHSTGPSSLAVDLTSDRVGRARWLLDGMAAGQTFRALLGYRATRLLAEEGRWAEIETLRGQHPLSVTVDGDPAGAREIDGLALFESLRQRLAPLSPDDQRMFDMLFDLVDATSDLLVAEAVHQSVQARPARARLALEALETFERPVTDREVIATPVQQVRSSLSVVLSLRADGAIWASGASCPRAVAEPILESWVAGLLGDPARLAMVIRTDTSEREVSLGDLGLCALDVAWLSGTDESEPPLFDLVRAWATGGGQQPATVVTNGPLGEALLVARSSLRLLTSARALRGADLVDGEQSTAEPAPSNAIADRVAATDQALATLLVGVDAQDPMALLRASALFGAPIPHTAGAAHAMSLGLVSRRDASGTAADARARLAALVGSDLPITDALVWPTPAPLAPTELPAGTAGAWLHDLGRVRAALEPLDELLLLTADMAVSGFRLGPAQRLLAVGAAPGTTITGLFLDKLTEAQSTSTITTGAAFHYEAPDAAPPQTILIAVPADVEHGWDHGRLAETVAGLLDLARLRALTLDDVASHYLPVTCVPENLASQGVSTPFGEVVVGPVLREG